MKKWHPWEDSSFPAEWGKASLEWSAVCISVSSISQWTGLPEPDCQIHLGPFLRSWNKTHAKPYSLKSGKAERRNKFKCLNIVLGYNCCSVKFILNGGGARAVELPNPFLCVCHRSHRKPYFSTDTGRTTGWAEINGATLHFPEYLENNQR